MSARTEHTLELNQMAGPRVAGTVGFVAALRAQIVLLHRTQRTLMLMGGAAIAVVLSIVAEVFYSTAVGRGIREAIEPGGFNLLSLHGWIVIVAAAWGIAVWWEETPARREHVLAAPADITLHELARVTAGGLWLLGMLALTTALALMVQLAGGRDAIAGNVAPSAWIALFSGPLLAYTLTATISTATRRSIPAVLGGVVLMGIAFAFMAQRALRSALSDGDPTDVYVVMRYSLFNAVSGLVKTIASHTTHISDNQTTTVSTAVHGASMMPYWLEASLLWWTIALLALAFVLWRRRRA